VRYARLAPGRGFSPLRACAQALDRLMLDPTVRYLAEETLSRAVSFFQPASPVSDPNLRDKVAQLRKTGLIRLGPMLNAAQIADICGSLAGAPVFDATDRLRTLNAPGTADAAIIGYPIPVVLGCPHLLELANEPRLLALVGAYLGCKPTIITWGLLRSRPAIGCAAITQKFHRDREGWRSVKLFVYLTDVDEVAGPHMYACGSHRTRSSLRARCYSDAEVAARTGSQNIATITGEAGFGFLADTFGLHKGESPAARERLILQIHYACVPSPLYIYGPLRPSRAVHGLDPYVNRLFLARADEPEARLDECESVPQPGKKEEITAVP
jgi:hypothetical protein